MKIITLAFAIALLSSAVWPNIALAASATTTFHGQSGRVTGKARSDGGITTFYDPAGRVTGKARSEHGTTTYYDAAGRVVGKARSTKQ
jgi:YD repeat-containing protein